MQETGPTVYSPYPRRLYIFHILDHCSYLGSMVACLILQYCHKGPTQAASLVVCSKYKEMYVRILKSLNIANLYRGMSKLELKINERFGGFCVDCYHYVIT